MTPQTGAGAPTGLVLPVPPRPAGAYRPALVVDGLLYLSSFGPRDESGRPIGGMVGREHDLAAAQALARNAGLTMLAVIVEALGSLDRVRQVIRVTGMVWAEPEFVQHPQVVDGCSALFREAFGERGQHTRAAFGVASLPFGVPVSLDCICRIEE